MAYYAALISLIQLLKEITHPEHPYSAYIVLDNQQLHLSLSEKFNRLQELLDGYSRKDRKDESADLLESRIRDVACDAQDIIESHVLDPFSREKVKTNVVSIVEIVEELMMIKLYYEELEKVKNVGSIVEELMTIKDSAPTREEYLQKKYNQELEKVKTTAGSIVEELMTIKHNDTTPEEYLQKKYYQELEKVKTNVGSIVEELMTINDSATTREEYLQNKYYQELEKVKTNVGSIVEIVEELMTIKDSQTTREEYLQKKYYEGLEKVKTNVGSIVEIVEELMTIKDSAPTREECLQNKKYNQELEKVKTNVGSIVEIVEELKTIKGYGTTREECLQKKHYEELEKVKAEVDSIVEEMESLTTQEEGLQRSSYISADSFRGAPKVEAQSCISTMVVFDEEFMTTIKAQLCGEPSTLEVVSIVGMGGLGKTTLARNIFDSKLIHDHFDYHAWVTISQDYHLPKVLQDIANSMNIKEKEGLTENIHKHLFGRRYLIVIDDIWDIKVWDDIKWIFPDNSNGSRIMITTRVSDVVVHAGSSKFLHQMQFLNEEQSWTLLQRKVFTEERCPEELEVVGKLIAKNCRGLPLGIVVIAGVLSNVNKVQHDWEEIARHVSSVAIDQNDEHLSNILSLSYNHLPHHLKPCFLYLGGFPEDHDIRISQLIRLWVAEGFLRPIESKSLEEVGEEYLKDLANRNLIFFTEMKFDGKFKYCSVHDLVRDLCLQRAHHEKFLHCLQQDDVYHESIGNVRRVFASGKSLFRKYTTKRNSTIRTSIAFSKYEDQYFLSATTKCKLLRILDAPKLSIFDYSIDEIFELLHLRYLTLRTNFDLHISPSICKLWNLQTLIVEGRSVSLPCEIWKMQQLRHVIFDGNFVIFPPIPYGEISIIDGVPLLGRLQTLQRVNNFIFTRHNIEMIPSLKKLAVYYPTYPSWEELGLNNLVHLHQLEKLEIYFDWFKPKIPFPENFAFPSSLTKLTLWGCKLPWTDMSVVGSLPNLLELKLKVAFVGEEWEPIEGEFLKLKFLLMDGLSYLKYWRAEYIHFPCLEQLHIVSCIKLKEIPSGIGDIPTLQFIRVKYCNSAVDSSALKIQEEQRDQGNNDLQVHVEPSWNLWAGEDESNSEEENESNAEEDESNSEEEADEEDESNAEEKDESNAEEDESNSKEEDES